MEINTGLTASLISLATDKLWPATERPKLQLQTRTLSTYPEVEL